MRYRRAHHTVEIHWTAWIRTDPVWSNSAVEANAAQGRRHRVDRTGTLIVKRVGRCPDYDRQRRGQHNGLRACVLGPLKRADRSLRARLSAAHRRVARRSLFPHQTSSPRPSRPQSGDLGCSSGADRSGSCDPEGNGRVAIGLGYADVMDSLKGKRVLVTGGARRIGRGLAMTLARAGANVAITYRGSADQAEHVVIDLGSFGVQADRKSVVEGKRVDLGGRRIIKKK